MKKYKGLSLTALIATIFSGIMVLYSQIPTSVVIILNTCFVLWMYTRFRKFFFVRESIFLCTIFLVPTSSISVSGTSYANFPLSWFHLLVIVLFIITIVENRINNRYFFLTVMFMFYSIIQSLFVANIFFDAMKQILTITLFLFSFIIGMSLKRNSNYDFPVVATNFYLCTVFSVGIQIILQRTFLYAKMIKVGHYAVMGGGRKAFAGLLSDYSFASLYLASGCLLLLIFYFELKKINLISFVIGELFLFFSTLIVTARTGFAALAIVVALYFMCNFKKFGWKIVIFLFLILIGSPYILKKMLIARGGQSFLDSSGRIDNYIEALNIFQKKTLFGVGLGLQNLKDNYNLVVPHNFFIQYLLQIGILGLLTILLFFVFYLQNSMNRHNPIKWVFWLIAIGSMLIPDIFSSRFLYVIIILGMLPMKKKVVEI